MFKSKVAKVEHLEDQYLELILDILSNGSDEKGRNGNTKVVIGTTMYFSMDNNTIPLLTTKKVAWKTCLKELLWFVRGQTDNSILKEQKCFIWNGNSTREYLDSRNLDYKEDDLGPVYGHQWRHFNAPYQNCHTNYNGKGVDQLQYIIDSLKNPENRNSRRLVLSAWNPCQLDEMALPPCHILVQFHVTNENLLSCSMFQRSGDVGLGVPFNIASYSFLLHLVAHHCDLIPHEFYYHLGNAHIYEDHLKPLELQCKKKPYKFPTLNIKNKRERIEDYNIDDFEVLNYKFGEKIVMNMVV
jgi:thymidylate synthase